MANSSTAHSSWLRRLIPASKARWTLGPPGPRRFWAGPLWRIALWACCCVRITRAHVVGGCGAGTSCSARPQPAGGCSLPCSPHQGGASGHRSADSPHELTAGPPVLAATRNPAPGEPWNVLRWGPRATRARVPLGALGWSTRPLAELGLQQRSHCCSDRYPTAPNLLC